MRSPPEAISVVNNTQFLSDVNAMLKVFQLVHENVCVVFTACICHEGRKFQTWTNQVTVSVGLNESRRIGIVELAWRIPSKDK